MNSRWASALEPLVISHFAEELNLSSIEICLDDAWAQGRPEFRKKIRESVALKLHLPEARQLNIVPHHPQFAISIAHSPIVGGFAWAREKVLLGFDIESEDRVKASTVKRVSSDQEMKEAPEPAVLWTAKESVFKAMSIEQDLDVLSQIEVSNWTTSRMGHLFQASLRGDESRNFQKIRGLGLAVIVLGQWMTIFAQSPAQLSSRANR